MTVAASLNCKSEVSAQEETKKNRSKCPGVRVVGGRIYDSQNGKTCHQCRQKTMDFAASCTNQNGSKECPIKFCHKCLLNRYGEKAEEVALLDDWKCPKCQGICNCSICMKKRGHQPTGILVRTAKENGFSSVSELLQVKGPENLGYYKIAKGKDVSPMKSTYSMKEPMDFSPRKPGKENSFNGNVDLKLESHDLTLISKGKKSKKPKREGLKEVSNGNRDDDANLRENGCKKPRITEEVSKSEVKTSEKDEGNAVKKRKSKTQSKDIPKAEKKKKGKAQDVLAKDKRSKIHHEKALRPCKLYDCSSAHENKQINSEPKLPHETKQINTEPKLPLGTCLTTVAGVELSPEDVGLALQFLEFCGCFGKVLDMRKGQAEAVIREIINGRRGRRSQYSCVGQIHNQLLSIMQKAIGEESPAPSSKNGQTSWLQNLGKCVSKSLFMSKELQSDCFDWGNEGYDKLNPSKKLRLLNFLCDEVLNTNDLRSWINDQNSKFLQKKKETKGMILAAKDKEKQFKQKMQGELAKAILGTNGAPQTVADNVAVVSQIKIEAAQAHAEILEAKGMLSKKEHRADAVRTDPILLDINGRAFWRLNGYDGRSDILLQDMETWNSEACNEKWFIYNGERKQEIEKYISSLRRKRLWAQKVSASTN